MKSAKAGGWIAGTAFLAVIIVALAWFFAISPAVATASETSVQATAESDNNELTKLKIARLKTQFAQLDELKAQLAGIQLQLPTSYDLSEYQRQLAAIAEAHAVTVVNLQVAPAVPVEPVLTAAQIAAADAAATAAAAADVSKEAAGTASVAPATPAGTAGVEGFYSMAVSLELVGTYQNCLAFLNALQQGTQRLFLVSGLTGTAQDQAEGGDGMPATNQGDLDLVVTGSLYVLTDPASAVVVPPAGDAPAPVLPLPDPNRNPLLPLG